jgi:hypothetical protein
MTNAGESADFLSSAMDATFVDITLTLIRQSRRDSDALKVSHLMSTPQENRGRGFYCFTPFARIARTRSRSSGVSTETSWP